MQARRVDIPQHFSSGAVYLNQPSGGLVRYVSWVCADPEIPVRSDADRECLAEVAPLAEVFAVQIESLNPPVLAVGYVNRPVTDHDPVYQMELAGTRAG